ncbi:unnamed protein product [Clavelina lepadiformis]|uniref:SH3 domain-containing protein n=1 Tax=Clavelina lepadiformis TaxID=159417 RepID=A0ABP0H3C6_CLALP
MCMVKMYKAIHSYSGRKGGSHTLPINNGDILCVLEKTNDSWWLASNADGKIGYVPVTYVKLDHKYDSKDVVLQSVDRAIAAVYASAENGRLSDQQQSLLKKLTKHKDETLTSMKHNKQNHSKRQAPAPPVQCTITPPPPPRSISLNQETALSQPQPVQSFNTSVCTEGVSKAVEEFVLEASHTETVSLKTQEDNFAADRSNIVVGIPNHLGEDLVHLVQEQTKLREGRSRELVASIAKMIGESIPSISNVMNEIVEVLPTAEIMSDPNIEKLGLALANLTEIKDDAQQRNWAIEDDKQKITTILNDIIESLSNGNKQDCINELLKDDCQSVTMLTVYHQMESRVSIRILVLQVLGVICSLSTKFISALLPTVLPDELVRDITEHCDDIQRICFSALVLSMVFSTGEPVPVGYYDTVGEKFIGFLLKCIENGLEEDSQDQVGDIFVRLILSINLHFLIPQDNLTLNAVVTGQSSTTLSEKIMLLVNRGDDPVVTCEANDCPPPHSVVKFLQDIFSRDDTAQSFLYTNDLLVLIDILTRNISDLSPGDKLRTEYLDLLLNVLKRSSYHETKHKGNEILSVLERIRDEDAFIEDNLQTNVEFDKRIVNIILQEHKDCLV